MVLAGGRDGFVAPLAVAGVEALDQLQVVQGLERPVNARDADRTSFVPQGVVDFLRAGRAVLATEVFDDGIARASAAEAAVLQHVAGVIGPVVSVAHVVLPATTRAAIAASR